MRDLRSETWIVRCSSSRNEYTADSHAKRRKIGIGIEISANCRGLVAGIILHGVYLIVSLIWLLLSPICANTRHLFIVDRVRQSDWLSDCMHICDCVVCNYCNQSAEFYFVRLFCIFIFRLFFFAPVSYFVRPSCSIIFEYEKYIRWLQPERNKLAFGFWCFSSVLFWIELNWFRNDWCNGAKCRSFGEIHVWEKKEIDFQKFATNSN